MTMPPTKISIITITCRKDGRLDDMFKTIAGSLAQVKEATPPEIEWIVVDENFMTSNDDVTNDRVRDNFRVIRRRPLWSPHRVAHDRTPAHNSARNAGLLSATGDYVVFLDDCTVVSRNWIELVRDVAIAGLGLRVRAFAQVDIAIPPTGALVFRDSHDRFHAIPSSTVAGSCWGAPKAAFDKIGGFDLAYDGQDKGHDTDAIERLARAGVSWVTSKRANVVSLKRTKLKNAVSANREALYGARNRMLLSQLAADPRRILPLASMSTLDHPTIARRNAATPSTPHVDPSRTTESARAEALAASIVDAELKLKRPLAPGERAFLELCHTHQADVKPIEIFEAPKPGVEDPPMSAWKNLEVSAPINPVNGAVVPDLVIDGVDEEALLDDLGLD